MEKDDLYFAVGTALSLVALVITILGTDWKAVRGKLKMPQVRKRDWVIAGFLALSLCFSITGWYKETHRDLLKWTMQQGQEEEIYQKTFRNEEVVLDGKRFDHCTFDNVTFVYHATKPVDYIEANFVPNGKIFLRSDNDSVKGFMTIYSWLSHQPNIGEVFGGSIDESGNITSQFDDVVVPPQQPQEPAPKQR
jgi:hypothetical protein